MIPDTKKVQSLINQIADAIDAAKEISVIRAKYIEQTPSIADTPLAGQGAQINAWLDSIEALLSDPIADLFVNSKVKSHRGSAL